MKQWKLVLVALLAVLLVCACTSALAADCTHPTDKLTATGNQTVSYTKNGTNHIKVTTVEYICGACNKLVEFSASPVEEEHTPGAETETAPTCTVAGYYSSSCTKCGVQTNKYASGKPAAHTYGAATETKVCGENIKYTETCTKCGYVNTYEGAKFNHELKETKETKVCGEKAKYEEICKHCGKVYNTYTGETVAHTYGAAVETKVCGEETVYAETCTKCGYVNTYEGAVMPHELKETKETKACGELTKYEDICKTCGKVYNTYYSNAPLAHSYPAGKTQEVKVCGEKVQYTDVCERCGYVNTYDGAVVACVADTANPEVIETCGSETVYNEYCKNCGKKVNSYKGAVKPHQEKTEVTDATCTEDGLVIKYCEECGVVLYEEVKGAFGHHWLWMDKVNATCTEDGHEKYSYCENCEIENPNAPKVVISSKGHKFYTAAQIAADPTGKTTGFYKAASCTEDGYAYALCSVHSDNKDLFKYTVLPTLGHSWTNWNVTSQLSCEDDLVAERYCNRGCGEVDEKTFETAYGHAWIIKAGTDATCTENGLVTRVCDNCGEEEKNKIVTATGHDYVWNTTAATPSADGVKEYKCTVCGDVAKTEVIRYTAMRYSNTATAFGPTTKELVGGTEWARVTPIDLSVEGTFSYPLVASNQYVIGTVTVVIANGTFTVTYDVAASQIKVTAEDLLVYADKAALAAGTAQEYAFGAPIQIGEDAKVIISVLLTVDYDAVGAGVSGFDADAAQIAAMTGIID